MARKRPSDVPEETARILYLTYGHDAIHMAELRCTELQTAGDEQGLATWKQVLEHVRTLAAGSPEQRASSHYCASYKRRIVGAPGRW